jgi:hypothetical protein
MKIIIRLCHPKVDKYVKFGLLAHGHYNRCFSMSPPLPLKVHMTQSKDDTNASQSVNQPRLETTQQQQRTIK